MNIGQAIKTLRISKGVKQYVLAENIGITQPYLSLLEKSKRKPSLFTLELIVKSLGISLALLFENVTE